MFCMIQNIFYRKIIRAGLVAIGIIVPVFFVYAEISITEIAWMGTSASQYEEWVELYNDGADDTSLTGWKLFKAGGVTLFSPTGTIPAGTYYLLCRATTTLTDPLGGTCNEKGTFGGSGLNNTNDQLVLKDAAGVTKESLDASGGWPAGNTASKQTMQKSGTDWITAVGTPGSETISVDSDPSPNPDPTADPDPTPDPTPPPTPTKDSKEKIEKVEPDPIYKARMIIPDFGTAGVAIPMRATVTKNSRGGFISGRFEWSTGDGGSYKFLKNITSNHIYYYPGTYQVVMQYYSDRFRDQPDTIHKKTITIVPSDIEILGYSNTDGLQLKNGASKEIALDGWIIQSSGQEFIFPNYTTLAKGATLALSPKVLGITLSKNSILLLNPSREIVTGYSYKYTAPATDDEIFIDEPDLQPLSTQPPSNSLLEGGSTEHVAESKTIGDIWKQNKWYVIFGSVVLLVILAYLAFHLYAKRDELL